jgi:hypothetical protein
MNIYEERDQLVEKRNYLQDKLKNYKDLKNRTVCPCCEREINWKAYQALIPSIEYKLQEIEKRFDIIIPEIIKLTREKARIREINQKEKQKIVQDYLQKNRNILNKSIRDYNKGVDDYLPKIIDKKEQQLWNKAMELQLDNRNMNENDELYFEI